MTIDDLCLYLIPAIGILIGFSLIRREKTVGLNKIIVTKWSVLVVAIFAIFPFAFYYGTRIVFENKARTILNENNYEVFSINVYTKAHRRNYRPRNIYEFTAIKDGERRSGLITVGSYYLSGFGSGYSIDIR